MAADTKRRFKRSQFAIVLVLAPLNGTFERKCLVIPFAPAVLKLGRQTTARSAASPDNGFFDSRVLSRQHAEAWADRETGKVWLRDCKSSNGTYINKQRLSAENTESEPFELKRGDQLDLGIDIVGNDDPKQVFKKISARVEKVSMLPINVGLQTSPSQGPLSQSSAAQQRHKEGPQLARSPSLETLRRTDPVLPRPNRTSDAIFGGSVEALALNHLNTTAGGLMMKDSVKSLIEFEHAAKRLVAQIRAVKADTAKIQSVSSVLEEIKRAAVEAEERDESERRKLEADRREFERRDQERRENSKSSVLAALRAENARMRAELSRARERDAHLPDPHDKTANDTHSFSGTAAAGPGAVAAAAASSGTGMAGSPITASPDIASSRPTKRGTHEPFQDNTDTHNFLVLLGTTLLVTLSGVCIMFFFNPPASERLERHPFISSQAV